MQQASAPCAKSSTNKTCHLYILDWGDLPVMLSPCLFLCVSLPRQGKEHVSVLKQKKQRDRAASEARRRPTHANNPES